MVVTHLPRYHEVGGRGHRSGEVRAMRVNCAWHLIARRRSAVGIVQGPLKKGAKIQNSKRQTFGVACMPNQVNAC